MNRLTISLNRVGGIKRHIDHSEFDFIFEAKIDNSKHPIYLKVKTYDPEKASPSVVINKSRFEIDNREFVEKYCERITGNNNYFLFNQILLEKTVEVAKDS